MMPCSSDAYSNEFLGPEMTGRGTPKADAEITFRCDGNGATFVARQYASYPYHLTRPFYLDEQWPQMATMYLTSISGGLVQADRIACHVEVDPGAAAHVTDSAAAKIHTMDEDKACLTVTLDVHDNAHLEYIAEPAILFPRSSLELRTSITLGKGASAIYAESYLTHAPESAKDCFDQFFSELSVRDTRGQLNALDRFHIKGGNSVLRTPGILNNAFAQGMVYILGPDTSKALDGIRSLLANLEGIYGGVSTLPNSCGLCTRVLATDGDSLRKAIAAIWTRARLLTKGISAVSRKK